MKWGEKELRNKIMLIEDDDMLSTIISEHLSRYEYDVIVPSSFNKVVDTFEQARPDLVILDINLPYYDGYFLCNAFRKKSRVPIIILSARSSNLDQIMGMELGADDYLTKPIDLGVLLSRIKAVIRRAYGEYANTSEPLLALKGLNLNEDTFKVGYKGNSIELTKNEFKLLKALMAQHDHYIPREELLSALWDDASFVNDNTLTVNIGRIKAKSEELGIHDLIKTKRGFGYALDTGVL